VKTFAKALALASVVGLSAPSTAGFGIGLGAPLEERVGGDYGPEYYNALRLMPCPMLSSARTMK